MSASDTGRTRAMTHWWKSSLALSLGLLVTGARGDDNGWRVSPQARTAPAAAPAPAVVLEKPIPRVAPADPPAAVPPGGAPVSASEAWSRSGPASPAVGLGRPVAILDRPVPLGNPV